jgi:hypothetical protein
MTIRAQLRRLHSPDVFDLEHYMPEDAEVFGILVQAMIGPQEGVGEESFDFLVCTPHWLATQVLNRGYVLGRHYLFLSRYDYGVLRQAIQDVCDQAHGEDWQSVAAYLGRFGHWEFEDYKP